MWQQAALELHGVCPGHNISLKCQDLNQRKNAVTQQAVEGTVLHILPESSLWQPMSGPHAGSWAEACGGACCRASTATRWRRRAT